MKNCDVAIIGAGPYGLSIAAHLRGLNYRIFGSPMHTWIEHMPKGMRLKSDGLASSLYEPDGKFTLEAYCKERGLPYADLGLPVPSETFVAYGLEFQRRFVPQLEQKGVVSLRRSGGVYQIRLEDGEELTARKVVVAVGLSYYEYLPPSLSGLPESHLTHSSKHKNLDRFKDRDVVVVGAGASALDTAALLRQAGSRVCVVARTPVIRMWDPPKPAPTSFIEWVRNPISGLGRGWRLYLCAKAPLVFRLMSEEFRLRKVREVLGPNPSWFIKPEIEGKVPLHPGFSIKSVQVHAGKAKLEVTDKSGAVRIFEADHIIAATGYRVDLRRLPFFKADLLEQIRMVEHTPVLSSNFESSLPGLYFVGTSAANTFGPLLRFAVGAEFTAQRLSGHLAKRVARNGEQGGNGTNNSSADRQINETNVQKPGQKTVGASRVLLTATVEWSIISGFATALARAGSDVSIVCPPRCPMPKTGDVRCVFHHRRLNPRKSLIEAIKATCPGIIIPCDDQAVEQLHDLHAWASAQGARGNEIKCLVEKSIGSPDSYPIVSSRYELLKVARDAGLRVPDTEKIHSAAELKKWQVQHPPPCVLKVDGTYGGYGVRIAHSSEQADESFLSLKRLFDFGRVLKRFCVNRDAFRLWPWWNGAKPTISVQAYVHGRPANCAAVCWEGQVLAIIAVEVVSTVGPIGRASIVRISDNREMTVAAERIASRLRLSGFFGLDFMIEDATELVYLIEMNPRIARPFHLQLGKGRDLIGALCAKISGQPIRELPSITENKLIAYFPDARDARSELLDSSYHDISEGEDDLLQGSHRSGPRATLFLRLAGHLEHLKQSLRRRISKHQPKAQTDWSFQRHSKP